MTLLLHLTLWLQLLGLGSDSFPCRHAALLRLRGTGVLARPALSTGFRCSKDPEVRRTCDLLLAETEGPCEALRTRLRWAWLFGCGVHAEPRGRVLEAFRDLPYAQQADVFIWARAFGLSREDEKDTYYFYDDSFNYVTYPENVFRLARHRLRWQAFRLHEPYPPGDLP